jgi:hypothetical protein
LQAQRGWVGFAQSDKVPKFPLSTFNSCRSFLNVVLCEHDLIECPPLILLRPARLALELQRLPCQILATHLLLSSDLPSSNSKGPLLESIWAWRLGDVVSHACHDSKWYTSRCPIGSDACAYPAQKDIAGQEIYVKECLDHVSPGFSVGEVVLKAKDALI